MTVLIRVNDTRRRKVTDGADKVFSWGDASRCAPGRGRRAAGERGVSPALARAASNCPLAMPWPTLDSVRPRERRRLLRTAIFGRSGWSWGKEAFFEEEELAGRAGWSSKTVTKRRLRSILMVSARQGPSEQS